MRVRGTCKVVKIADSSQIMRHSYISTHCNICSIQTCNYAVACGAISLWHFSILSSNFKLVGVLLVYDPTSYIFRSTELDLLCLIEKRNAYLKITNENDVIDAKRD
eukprot:Phypoly_transcript_22117.p1 GENE.Phypoly_transcript_22117~~Phypoly_transcript_22117.p1  ORF type:complete len:106 (-),score=1.87 Phypoly_transcript_22117:201-518(-)